MTDNLPPSRLRPADVFRVGAAGLRARPTRVALSALGIAIGIAAMIAVVGISVSGGAQLSRQLDKLGTNLLKLEPGDPDTSPLPETAPAQIRRIPPVTAVSSIGAVAGYVYRSDLINTFESGGIKIFAASLDLPSTLSSSIASGAWLNSATENFPSIVLGHKTAIQLGITHAGPGVQIYAAQTWFTVVGIIDELPLAPELDTTVFIGWKYAQQHLGFNGRATTVFVRAENDKVLQVRDVLAYAANPESPGAVKVSRPSDALAARAAADQTFTALLLGVGAVALLVGGVGVANTMVISVLERRGEIGLRRSLGATKAHVRTQFLTESLLLATVGGFVGVILGLTATMINSALRGWPTMVPLWATLGGLLATVFIGVIAGWFPAARAARLSPTEALAAP